jgi:uncharacterized protein (TIGR03083 family)
MTAPTSAMTRDALLADLRDVWGSLDDLLDSLADEDWDAPTAVPGWTVHDQVAHVIGVESMMAGLPTPDVEIPDLPHLRNDVGRMNEAWIIALRGESPRAMLARFREIVARRTGQIEAMTDEELTAETWTPAGMADMARFLQIRVFDQWIHEQDIRDGVGREGHLHGPAVRRTLAEVANGVGFVVGKKAGAPDGSSVRFQVTGPEEATIDVVVDGRARVTDDLAGDPTVTLTTDTGTFVRLVAGREPGEAALADGRVELAGDTDLGGRVLASLAYVI